MTETQIATLTSFARNDKMLSLRAAKGLAKQVPCDVAISLLSRNPGVAICVRDHLPRSYLFNRKSEIVNRTIVSLLLAVLFFKTIPPHIANQFNVTRMNSFRPPYIGVKFH
jgi:hypothetical protein